VSGVQFGGEGDRPRRRGRKLHGEVRDVSRAGRDEARVEKTAGLPGVALVDGVGFGVELVGAIEVRSGFHGTLAVVADVAAPEYDPSIGVLGLDLEPDGEGVHGAAGKEVADLTPAADDVHA